MNAGTEINTAFVKALLAEDEVGCVIRSHLYVEAQIDRYLGLAVVEPKHLSDLDLPCSLELGDRIQIFERAGEGVAQAPEGSCREFLMQRLEIIPMHRHHQARWRL